MSRFLFIKKRFFSLQELYSFCWWWWWIKRRLQHYRHLDYWRTHHISSDNSISCLKWAYSIMEFLTLVIWPNHFQGLFYMYRRPQLKWLSRMSYIYVFRLPDVCYVLELLNETINSLSASSRAHFNQWIHIMLQRISEIFARKAFLPSCGGVNHRYILVLPLKYGPFCYVSLVLTTSARGTNKHSRKALLYFDFAERRWCGATRPRNWKCRIQKHYPI